MLDYDMPLYRPPAEAYNVIIQVTLGCSFNKCAFCSMYEDKEYKQRDFKKICEDIDTMVSYYPQSTKVFLADGDALNLETSFLVKILEYLYKNFTKLRRVSSYASPFNLLQKSQEELNLIKEKGLGLIYYGIESGNEKILKAINKPMKANKMIEGLNKASLAGIKISATIILGLAGKNFSKEHITQSAKLINSCTHINYLSSLQLGLSDKKEDKYFKNFEKTIGAFEFCSDNEMLEEQLLLISLLSPKSRIIFRSNHASNSLPLKGTLPKDKDKLIEVLKVALKDESLLRPKSLRGF